MGAGSSGLTPGPTSIFDEERDMKTKWAAALASVLFLALAAPAFAAEGTAPKSMAVHDKITVKATVVAVDHANRVVSLKGPQGTVVDLEVDESVKRFDNLKVGDTVNVAYYESVAYEIQKPGTPMKPDTITTQGGKFTGSKPGGAVADTTVSTVTVTAIDMATPSVTIRTSDGAIQNYFVRHKENLAGVKVGDVVMVTRKKALAISVEEAQ
jgi:hypothetical protein